MERFLDEQKQKSNHFQQFEFQTSQVEFGKSSGYDWHKSCQYFRGNKSTQNKGNNNYIQTTIRTSEN